MSRLVLVLNLDPELDVEAYRMAGRLESMPGVRSVEVRTLEPHDELVKLSTVMEGIQSGLENGIRNALGNCYVIPAAPEQAGADDYDRDETRRQSIAALGRPAPPTPEEIAAHNARRDAEAAERMRAQQVETRARLEAYDQAAARVAAEKRERAMMIGVPFSAPPKIPECHGGCSRGGEGPSCGKPGCY